MANEHFRVFHCPIEIAGQMGAMIQGLKQLGHEAVGINSFRTYLQYDQNIMNGSWEEIVQFYEQVKNDYDIFHYHFGASIYNDQRDVLELKQMGKKLVMHHWGNDVRIQAKARQLSPYLQDPCNPLSDDVMIERLKRNGELFKTVIIQDFELYDYVKEYFPNIFVLPLALDVNRLVPVFPNPNKLVPLIIHAPTQPTFKGTATIEAVLDQLRAAGFHFEYKRIEKMSHKEALQLYQTADIIIDQILVGSHGVLAVESMAQGKPVVSYIREDLKPLFPHDLPIVSANPTTLYQQLIPLITNGQLRHEIGLRSRQYALNRHDLSVVIPQLLDIYRVVLTT